MTSVADIFIRGSAADPAVAAQRALVARGEDLLAALSAKVAVTTELRVSMVEREAAQERLLRFCLERLLPHLSGTDSALYAVAAGNAETRLLVRALRSQHDVLRAHVAELDRAENQDDVTAAAHALVAVLHGCYEVERRVFLPALEQLPGVDLPGLVEDVALLESGGSLAVPEVLDVREIPHGRRHPTIFGVFSRLGSGDAFVLLNNHDPKPLRREFEATYPSQFAWDYVESGPSRWQVRITRHTVT